MIEEKKFQLSKGSEVHDRLSIVNTVYVQLSDGWTGNSKLSNDWTALVQLS